MKNYRSYFLGAFILFAGCEENPFFGDDKISNRSITGDVKLGNVEYYPDGYHGGVFVWAEGLGIKTTTDINGSFELARKISQHTPGDLNRIFLLYVDRQL